MTGRPKPASRESLLSAGGGVAHPPEGRERPAPSAVGVVVLVTVVLTLVVLVVVLPHLWYPLHDSSSDISIYHYYSDQIGQGLIPYLDFEIEYPPRAVPLRGTSGSLQLSLR